MICPVCGGDYVALVRHHDHYGECCRKLLWGTATSNWDSVGNEAASIALKSFGFHQKAWFIPAEDKPVDVPPDAWTSLFSYVKDARPIYRDCILRALSSLSFWDVFPDIEICQKCNSICAWIKAKRRYIPRFVSFSPDEMRILRNDDNLAALPVVWTNKVEQYRARNRKLLEVGVDRSTIEGFWRRPAEYLESSTDKYRREMLTLLAAAPSDFRSLCEEIGNDRILAERIGTFRWPPSAINSFVYWYHKKHGDSSCRNNEFGVGESAFVRWFKGVASGQAGSADADLNRRILWINR